MGTSDLIFEKFPYLCQSFQEGSLFYNNKLTITPNKLNQTQEMIFHPLQINIAMLAPGQDLPLHQVQNIFMAHII